MQRQSRSVAFLSGSAPLSPPQAGYPYASVFNHYTEAELLAYLKTGWGIGNVEDLQLSFLYGPEDDQ